MALAKSEEREPLLQNEHTSSVGSYHGQYTSNETSEKHTVVSPVGPDELPPPYSQSPEGGAHVVTCRVCQAMIDVSEKKDQHVVKCNQCNEATPIRNAPPGKKYVRCPCNCLLICKATSQRIACPRTNCKRMINLAPSPVAIAIPTVPGMSRVTCAYCYDMFLFNIVYSALARCPHCRKVSSVGPEFAQRRAILLLVLGILNLISSVGLAVGAFITKLYALYAAIVPLFLIAVFLIYRSIYYFKMKVSVIASPA